MRGSWMKSMAIVPMMAFAMSALGYAATLNYKPGEVIIKYKDSVMRQRAQVNALYNTTGVKKVRRYSELMDGFEQLTLRNDVKVEDAIATLNKSDLIEYAQPNYILYALDPTPPFPIPGGGNGGGGSLPCIPGMNIPGCDPNAKLPCIPGMDIPNCDPSACIMPGIPFPPGCKDGGGNIGNNPAPQPDPQPAPEPAPAPATGRPDLQPAPPEVNPPVADPDLNKAWGLTTIHAQEAWKITKGSKDIIVADIDTGIDYNHEDLSFNVWRNPNPSDQKDIVGFDFVHNDGLPYDDNMHGTHTAGTIGAVGFNGVGISGVAPRVSLMSLKFLSDQGSGTTADAIRAIDYAISHGAKILSNSWGGPAGDQQENKALYDAIDRAKAKGVLFVAAAGNDGADNDGDSASYPAAFDNDNIISVAATDEKDTLIFFSNYGKKSVHLAAPGVNIYSTLPGNQYKEESGTSMACPHVAGAAAMVWSVHPEWNYKQVKAALMQSVDSLPSLQGKTITGGRLNLLKAIQITPNLDQAQEPPRPQRPKKRRHLEVS